MNTPLLLARYGLKETDLHPSPCGRLSHAGELLERTQLHLHHRADELHQVLEDDFVLALRKASHQVHGLGGECLVNPMLAELPLSDIDLYMRGIVRWMNELKIYTAYCCDGHGKRVPYVYLLQFPTQKQLQLLRACFPDGMEMTVQGKRIVFHIENSVPQTLLQFAEKLYRIVENPSTLFRYEADGFKKSLLELLSVGGVSGQEDRIRRLIRRKLARLVDDLFVDRAGNVLGTIYCGEGPTVLLSAHMDIVDEIHPEREILQQGTILSSSKGILGADDRAGMAVILEICRRVHQSNFNGTLKIALTVKEEIGLVGSQKLDPWFLSDVDAAIVLDRRGNRDIVTSCGGVIPFCSPSYGQLFEKAGTLAGMNDWKAVNGGSSDARILSQQFEIETVNLSVGYQHEHTEHEIVDYLATYETVKLVETVLHYQLLQKKIDTTVLIYD